MTLSRAEDHPAPRPVAETGPRVVAGPAEPDVLAGLRGFAELPGWLAHAVQAGRVQAALERHVPEFSGGALRLVGCQPSRLRAKGERWLARYELVVAGPDVPGRPVVLVGVLEPPGAAPPPAPGAAPPGPGLPAPGSRCAVPFGEPDWVGWLPELGLRLRTEVGDDGLPALPLLTDPAAARPLLEEGIGRQAYPGIRIAECVPQIVRYKPGSRCTLRYRLRYADPGRGWPEAVVVKTHQGDKGANAFAAMRALWATGLASGAVVSIAQPLAYLPESRVLVQAAIPGEATVKDTIRAALFDGAPPALGQLRAQLHRTAAGLAALHRCGVRHGRVHTWHDELAEVREVLARLAGTLPVLADAADPLLARLEALAAGAGSDPPTGAHHDFRPAQVLLHGPGIGFIDFDGFCTAEPALDIGRFRAKLRDIGVFSKDTQTAAPTGPALARRLAVLDQLCEDFLAAYQQHAPVSRPRVLLWETLDLLTAVLHAWTKVRSARVAPRLALLDHHVRTQLFDGGSTS